MASNAVLRWGYDLLWDKWPVMLPPLIHKFWRRNGYLPNVLRPRTFNEKVLHRMLFDRRPLLPLFTGKIESRAHVRHLLGDGATLRPAGIVRQPCDIGDIALPDRFIMKGNHGSGMVHLHQDGVPDLAALEALCEQWLANNYGKYAREWCYKDVERAVVIEPLLLDENGGLARDVKFYCYDGEPHFVSVVAGRYSGGTRDLFDSDWTNIPGVFDRPNSAVPPARPARLGEMLDMARTLSRCVDFVRVDLYDSHPAIVVGELTMTPDAGTTPFPTRALDLAFGAPWRLP